MHILFKETANLVHISTIIYILSLMMIDNCIMLVLFPKLLYQTDTVVKVELFMFHKMLCSITSSSTIN